MEEKKTVEEFFHEAPSVDDDRLVSRRNFLTGAVVGGATGLVVAAGTGTAVWKITDAELLAAKETAEAELEASKAASSADLDAAQAAAGFELQAARTQTAIRRW